MVFRTEAAPGVWITEHVENPDDKYAPRAIRFIWDVDERYGEVTARVRRRDRMDTGARNGRTSTPIPVPGEHLSELERGLALDTGASFDDITIEGVGDPAEARSSVQVEE